MRKATATDRDGFATLWWEFLVENQANGDPIEATEEALAWYMALFDSYVAGTTGGAVTIEPHSGVSMIGEFDEGPLRLIYQRPVRNWGLYVLPEHRKTGLGSDLYRESVEVVRSLGFSHLVDGHLVDSSTPARLVEETGGRVIGVTTVAPLQIAGCL